MSSKRPPPRLTPPPRSKPRASPQPPPFEIPPPPVQGAPSQKFSSEPPTKQKNVTASVYQSLLSVFDEMTPEQRMEFVDLASRYAALDGRTRYDLLELVSWLAVMGEPDRARLLELARTLAGSEPRR